MTRTVISNDPMHSARNQHSITQYRRNLGRLVTAADHNLPSSSSPAQQSWQLGSLAAWQHTRLGSNIFQTPSDVIVPVDPALPIEAFSP